MHSNCIQLYKVFQSNQKKTSPIEIGMQSHVKIYPLAYVIARAILVGKPWVEPFCRTCSTECIEQAIYNPDSCDCLHPEDRQGEVSVQIQNLWASFSLSQTPLKKIAHYNLLTSTKKKAIFLPFGGDLQQMGFRGLQLEGNVNVKSINGPFSASCHKLKASPSGKAWRRGHREVPGGFGFAFLSGTHIAWLPWLTASVSPPPAKSNCLCGSWLDSGSHRHLSNAVSAAYGKASIRCHNCWGDWVNG